MDRSFQSSSMASANRSFTGATTPKARNSIFSKKSIFPSSQKRNVSLSGRSNASTLQIVARSDYNLVESFGMGNPVKVNEMLMFSERNVAVSVNCSKDGWAWAVCGRKLLVWQYKDTRSRSQDSKSMKPRNTTSQCRELTLPHCDIGHKARLITVFVPENSQTAACLAVSTTGDVRYWPSIAHDGSSIDETGILEGQEFDQLTSIAPQGYLLVTTTCNLLLLQLQIQNGRQRIVHRTIKPPAGFFGGFGKKFASIIIGTNNQESENKLIKICYETVNSVEYFITVLSDNSLQRWLFTPNGTEQFIFEDHEIAKKVRDIYRTKMWPQRSASESLATWMLDMQSIDRGVIILAAGANLAHTPQIYLSLITIIAENDGFQVKDFQLLRYKAFHSLHQQQPNPWINMKFIICRGMAYMYNEKLIYPIVLNTQSNSPLVAPGDDMEKIEFQGQEDRIMSADNHQNIPLFFSRLHGVVCVSASDFDPDFFNNSAMTSGPGDVFSPTGNFGNTSVADMSIMSPNNTNVGNLTMFELDPEEIAETNKEDAVSQLKAAFIYHLKRNTHMCQEILKEMLLKNDGTQLDSDLDRIVITIAQDLAEDIPAADPRWEQEVNNQKHALGSSTSMQIVQQLREKSRAMNHFVDFLHASGLWKCLYAITERSNIKSTCSILSDINEKIVMSIALKCQHPGHQRLMDEAIEMVLKDNNIQVMGNLTAQDLFYTKVTKVHEIFRKFAEILENFVKNEASQNQLQNGIIEVNGIALQVLQEVMKFREKNSELFQVEDNQFENLPWTAANDGLRDSLLQMVALTLKNGIRLNGETEYRFKHYQQMTEIIDFILDGRRTYLASIQKKNQEKLNILQHQYESQRFDLIYPLVEDEQYELAAKLAEKYFDFQTLVIICDRTGNQQRLDEYIERFKDKDFSQFAISWHMKQNKQGDLFQRFKNNQVELGKFLHNHPSLAWIQLIFNGELEKAAMVLLDLAQNEIELVARKRTMLSLAKLSAFAAEGDMEQQLDEINKELHLIDHQEQIDEETLLSFGYDVNNLRVLQPEEIIDLYISEDNTNSTEIEYRRSLELLEYVEDSMEYRHRIWCSAIKRDSWTDFNMNAPLEKMQEMVFFKLIDLCFLLDHDVDNFLPPIDSFLLALELGPLINEKSFQYLLKLGYEHIYESYKVKE